MKIIKVGVYQFTKAYKTKNHNGTIPKGIIFHITKINKMGMAFSPNFTYGFTGEMEVKKLNNLQIIIDS